MSMRWIVALSTVAVVAVVIVPVFAQMPMGYGVGPMSGGMMGGGMMRGWTAQNSRPLTIERATQVARDGIARQYGVGLVPVHIMEFSNHFYVAVHDKAAGRGAFELLIDRYTGTTHPEPGPNMMWNTAYGHMSGVRMGGGMMGPGSATADPSAPNAVSAIPIDRAARLAQRFLDAQFPGTRTAESIAFPGYYTIDVARGSKMVGMLSVNAYSGQIWYHAWHGAFVQERDIE